MNALAFLATMFRARQAMLGAGIEPAWEFIPRDFKSLASTGFATRAENTSQRIKQRTEPEMNEAGNGIRTRDPNLGKVVLYQLSYSRNIDKATGAFSCQQASCIAASSSRRNPS